MNKKRFQTLVQHSEKLFISFIVAVSLTVFLLGDVEKTYAASNLLEDKKPGDIIRFDGKEWILLNPSERYIVMKDYWLKDGKPVTTPFNTRKTNKFDPNQKENIGYILNTEYYNTLIDKEKEMVSESVWDISPFLGVGIQTVRAKIGLLSLREWLEYKSVLGNPSWIFWTLTPHPQNNEQVFAIGADGNSNAWSTWKPEWPTVTHPALKLKPGVFVNSLTSELQPLEDDKNPPTISFEPNGNTTKKKVHSTKVWVYDWFGSGVKEATYRWKKDNQYVTGNIRMNEYPMIINTPDNGDGEYYLEVTAIDAAGNRSFQVSKPFVVGRLDVTHVETLADIEVDYGTSRSSLSLPSSVQVSLEDKSSTSLGVSWDNGSPAYNGNASGEYMFVGTLVENQDVINPQNLKAEVKVRVKPKPLEVISVTPLDALSAEYGTSRSSLPLPSTVQVTLNDGNIRSLDVTWDNGNPTYNGNTAGEYMFTGTLSEDVLNPKGLTAQMKVVVKSKPLEIESVNALTDILVEFGTTLSSLPLPSTVQVTLNDGNSRSLGVMWDNGSPTYNGNTAGEYMFTGTLSGEVSNPQGLSAEVKVVVASKPVEPPVVSRVESLDDIEVSYGTERSSLPLPPAVQVTLSDQTNRSLGVTWDDGTPEYDGNAAGEYTFTGTLAQEVSNPQGLMAEVKVIVNPKPAEPPVVSRVESLDDIEVSYGTERSALPLPPTVQVMLSDQTNRSLGVTWDNVSPVYNGNTAGEYTFTGTLSQEVSNPQGLMAEVKVIVNPKPAEPPVVSKVASIADIDVSYGTERSALPLPPTVQVMLSDQTSQSLGVTWDGGSPVYNGNTAGEYTFKGTLSREVDNPHNLTAQVKVIISSSESDSKSPIWPNGSKLMVSDITKTSVKLSWPEAQDTNGVIGYRIYVDNREPQTVTGNVYEQTVMGLTAGTTYTFTVKAFNATGNESEPLNAKATTARSSGGGGGGGNSGGEGLGSGFGGGRVLSSNADLADLQVWVGGKKLKLSPSFASGTTSYIARTEAEQVEIVAKDAHSAAKVILKDKVITDRTKVNLDEGDNMFVLTVQAENGTKKKYTLTIYRETSKRYEPVIEFTDIAGHWAESSIKRAAAKGIVSGYPDGTFRPNHPVTRAEFTVMLFSALQLEEDGATLTFTDQDQIGTWAKQTVAKAVKAGIVSGYGDGSFRPNAQITRAEMAVMIARALKLPLNANTVTDFADDESIPQWAKGSVEAIRELGITSGRVGNKFVPNDKATRAEATAMLLRMLERKENQ